MIDIVAAIESVVEAAAALHARAPRADDGPHGSVAETAVGLALPAARQPEAAARLLGTLRADPAGMARTYDCTLGAVLVWRAVDRAESDGEPCLAAAESGLRAALAYIDLVPPGQFTAAGADDLGRRAALARVELQARLALSRSQSAG